MRSAEGLTGAGVSAVLLMETSKPFLVRAVLPVTCGLALPDYVALAVFSGLKPQSPQKDSVASIYIPLHSTLRGQSWSVFSKTILVMKFVLHLCR